MMFDQMAQLAQAVGSAALLTTALNGLFVLAFMLALFGGAVFMLLGRR